MESNIIAFMALDVPAYRHILSRPADAPLSNYYELLGVARGESDPAVLEQAMLECVVKVRRYQTGAYEAQAAALLNKLGEAYVCLTDEEARRQYSQWLDSANQRGSIPASEAAPAAPSPAAAVCPQCGKPMSRRLTICYHCNYRRGATAATPVGEKPSVAPVPLDDDDAAQDEAPEPSLGRLDVMRDMYQAKRLAQKHWITTQPNLCHRCQHRLPSQTDAHGITCADLSRLSEFVVHFARRQHALGHHFDWPLSQAAIAELQEAIAGRNPKLVRLYCRNCAEKMFKSPRLT